MCAGAERNLSGIIIYIVCNCPLKTSVKCLKILCNVYQLIYIMKRLSSIPIKILIWLYFEGSQPNVYLKPKVHILFIVKQLNSLAALNVTLRQWKIWIYVFIFVKMILNIGVKATFMIDSICIWNFRLKATLNIVKQIYNELSHPWAQITPKSFYRQNIKCMNYGRTKEHLQEEGDNALVTYEEIPEDLSLENTLCNYYHSVFIRFRG